MRKEPRVQFFLADRQHPVVPGKDGWTKCLPRGLTASERQPDSDSLTYGDYFEAVSAFLGRNGGAAVARAAAAQDSTWAPGRAPSRIDIFLEKHGAFYHPCRVLAAVDRCRSELVVNVALSPESRNLIPAEVGLIETLARRFSLGCLPEVFDSGEVALADGRHLGMFLGQWFSDFCEFHLTRAATRQAALVVWTPNGPRFFDAFQCRALYRQAAVLLTGHYDVFSGKQILDWHHAAGDFVVRTDDSGSLALRLVTVRRYGSLFKDFEADLDKALAALALMLVHTTLWLRLDRCDGVGDFVLADLEMVESAVDGFFEALERKVDRGEIPSAMLTAAIAHLSTYRRQDFVELIMALTARRPSGDTTRMLLEDAASGHARKLKAALGVKTRSYRSRLILP